MPVSRKGAALALETIVMLILAAVVLGALLAFFLGIFTPTQSETELTRKQLTLCQQIATKDSLCRPGGAAQDLVNRLAKEVCQSTRPGCSTEGPKSREENCIASCCKIFCPAG